MSDSLEVGEMDAEPVLPVSAEESIAFERKYVRIAAQDVYQSPQELLPLYVDELASLCAKEGVTSLTRGWIDRNFPRCSRWIRRHGTLRGSREDPLWGEFKRLCEQRGLSLDIDFINKPQGRRIAELVALLRREKVREWSSTAVSRGSHSIFCGLVKFYGTPFGIRWAAIVKQLPEDLAADFCYLCPDRRLLESDPEELKLYVTYKRPILVKRLIQLLETHNPAVFGPCWILDARGGNGLYHTISRLIKLTGSSWHEFMAFLGPKWSSKFRMRADGNIHSEIHDDGSWEDDAPQDESPAETDLSGKYCVVAIPDMHDPQLVKYSGLDGERVFTLPPDYQGYKDLVKRVGGLRDSEVLAVLVNRGNALARVSKDCLIVD